MNKDTRYPYTYACDFLRMYGGCTSQGVSLSRADASQIRSAIAKAIGMPDEELACKLADYYKANQEALTDAAVNKLADAMGIK